MDFDFFTELPLDKKALLAAIPLLAQAETLREDPRTLLVSLVPPKTKRPVKLSFFGSANRSSPKTASSGSRRSTT